MPTFLVGFGRPAAEEGIAVDTASEAVASVPDSLDYQSYLMDARYVTVFFISLYSLGVAKRKSAPLKREETIYKL